MGSWEYGESNDARDDRWDALNDKRSEKIDSGVGNGKDAAECFWISVGEEGVLSSTGAEVEELLIRERDGDIYLFLGICDFWSLGLYSIC